MKKLFLNTKVLFILVALLGLFYGFSYQKVKDKQTKLPELKAGILLPTPKVLNSTNLLDHNGQAFTLENFKGKWNIVFFGFTHCPDICPTTLQKLKQVKLAVSKQGKWGNYRVVFVSVDPERDTPEKLKNYVSFFDNEFIGLTGKLADLHTFSKQLGIIFVKTAEKTAGVYDVDHGASIIYINPQAQMAGISSAPHDQESISNDLLTMADYFKADHQVSNVAPLSTTTVATGTNLNQDTQATDKLTNNALSIKNAWIRPAPKGAGEMAAYLDIYNNSNEDITISHIKGELFKMTMIHETVFTNGIAKMQHLSKLTIPANKMVSLKPQGIHLMLMSPTKPLILGDTTEFIISTSNGESITLPIEVKQP